jgi:hypothetical protein
MTLSYYSVRPATDIFVLSVVPVLFSDARGMSLKVKPIHSRGVTGYA